MNKKHNNYYKRDIFEFLAILEFIKKDSLNIDDFCNEWSKKNENTDLCRKEIESIICMSLETYLYKKSILKFNLNNIEKINDTNLLDLYSYINIMLYIIQNEYDKNNDLIIKNLSTDKNLEKIGYFYNDSQKKIIKYKITNLLLYLEKYNLIKSSLISFKDKIEQTKKVILNELQYRKKSSINNKKEKDIDKNIDLKTNLIDEKKSSNIDLDENLEKLKSIFEKFFNEISSIMPKYDNDNIKNFQKLNEEYSLLIKEKRNLQEQVENLKNNIKEMNDRFIELQSTIKSKECESNFKAVESIYKILNDKEDLFLDKIYASKHNNYKLNIEDVERMTSNIISNLETFGIRVNPMSKNINDKFEIKEQDISNYRVTNKILEEIALESNLEVKVKYPSWIYINKEYTKGFRTLDNEMLE